MQSPKLILVTGGAGFVGTRLCERLVRDGHRVISLDNYFAGSKDNHVSDVEYREGHTKDIETHIPETPDIIFHLGEYARVEQSMLEPDIVEDLNVRGTEAVLAFWRKSRAKLVYAGSSTKFGTGQTHSSPYVVTKAQNTEKVKKIGDSENLPYAITYFYNVYGPGERAGVYGTVIEAFKHMYLSGAPLSVTSPGTQVRNFTHVDDIVDGLVLVAEKGHGDEYGLGSDKSFSILDVARMFGGDVVMLPERAANRMQTGLDTAKSAALGWKPGRGLETYIQEFVRSCPRGAALEKRILVFSTTFGPMGPAEQALEELARKMPSVHFDVVTTRFSRDFPKEEHRGNVHIRRLGTGSSMDKYTLPILGFLSAHRMRAKHSYLFAWGLMASYGALAGVLLRRVTGTPLLITLADQRFEQLSAFRRVFFRAVLSDADQVYGVSTSQEAEASRRGTITLSRNSIGEGDAFANQLRYAYAELLLTRHRS